VNFEEGKLYKCSDHLLMIYPTRENAVAGNSVAPLWGYGTTVAAVVAARPTAVVAAHRTELTTAAWAAIYWSKKLGCSVSYSEPNEIFIFLKKEIIEEQKYINVLFGDKQGWIICKNWLRFERVL